MLKLLRIIQHSFAKFTQSMSSFPSAAGKSIDPRFMHNDSNTHSYFGIQFTKFRSDDAFGDFGIRYHSISFDCYCIIVNEK